MTPNDNGPQASGAELAPALPPVIGVPQQQLPDGNAESSLAKKWVAALSSICLGLFLADGIISFFDDSLIGFLDMHLLSLIRGVLFFFTIASTILIYGMMGLTPWVAKRWFLPVALFSPITSLASIPLTICHYDRLPQFVWVFSLLQVIVGLIVVRVVRGRLKFRWSLVSDKQLDGPGFTWRNLASFVAANLFLLAPGILVYLVLCAGMAVNHLTDGFMSLRPGGLTVQVRKYVGADGKTIQLFPMSHIADSDFYQKVSESFPTNSTILMEGVTDHSNLLTNKISYKRMAKTLGLSEQHEKFVPEQGEMVRADVDIDQFSTSTIGLLNVAMLIHAKGINPETVLALLSFPQPPGFQDQLIEDLLTNRNHHLLEVMRSRLLKSQDIIVPWGAMHMPGISREIEREGFHMTESQNYTVIGFGSARQFGQQHSPVTNRSIDTSQFRTAILAETLRMSPLHNHSWPSLHSPLADSSSLACGFCRWSKILAVKRSHGGKIRFSFNAPRANRNHFH